MRQVVGYQDGCTIFLGWRKDIDFFAVILYLHKTTSKDGGGFIGINFSTKILYEVRTCV